MVKLPPPFLLGESGSLLSLSNFIFPTTAVAETPPPSRTFSGELASLPGWLFEMTLDYFGN